MSNSGYKPTINYVSKDDLHPLFGKANFLTNTCEVREDLPNTSKKFVLEHELYHLGDSNFKSIIGREYRANLYAAKKHPIGFLTTVLMSLTPDKIRYYSNLIKQEKEFQKGRKLILEEIQNKD